MKILVVIGLCELSRQAASHFLHRRVSSAQTPTPPKLRTATKADYTGDVALGITASSGGGDYYTQAFTSENIGDPRRGTGACVAFRRTLKCNPSGIRDMKNDKGCQQVVNSDESGFCECGNYAQFAAVDCDHRPFTCEIMCLKFAMSTPNKEAYYRDRKLNASELETLGNNMMWANQTDLQAMRIMIEEIQDFMTKSIAYTNETSSHATASMQKFMDMMKDARKSDAESAAKALADYHATLDAKPWLKIWQNGEKLQETGKAIQAKVREVLPFDPVAETDHTLRWAMASR